jgi:hypothetical protein
MLGGERNGQQPQANLLHQQRQDQNIPEAAGCPHSEIGQAMFKQQRPGRNDNKELMKNELTEIFLAASGAPR